MKTLRAQICVVNVLDRRRAMVGFPLRKHTFEKYDVAATAGAPFLASFNVAMGNGKSASTIPFRKF